MRKPGAIIAVGGACLLAATAAFAEPVRPGEDTGLGLGVVPPQTPQVLKEAKSAPYVPPAGESCESVAREIAELDKALGPDADAAPKKQGLKPGKFIGQAVRSLIPYRAVVRVLTGADRAEAARNEAAMAGWARRGYLKGVQANLGCPGATAAPAPVTTTAASAPPAEPAADTLVTPAAAAEPPETPQTPVALGPLAEPQSTDPGLAR